MNDIFNRLKLPPNDLDPLNDAALSEEYDKLTDEIIGRGRDAEENQTSSDALLESESASYKEVEAVKTAKFEIRTDAVSFARRRLALRDRTAVVHSKFSAAAQQTLAETRERKTTQLRQLCGGQLPWGWDSTISSACLVESQNANWRPALLREQIVREELAPLALAKSALRALIVREIGAE